MVSKDDQGYYTLSNKVASTTFVLTKSQGAINDLVMYGTQTQGNTDTLFRITEVTSGEKGRYLSVMPFILSVGLHVDVR